GLRGYFHYHSLHNLDGKLPPQLAGLINIHAFMNVPTHIAGQLLLSMPVMTLFGWGVASLGFLLSPYIAFLRKAFLMLAGMGVLRILIGAAGVPASVGTWISSLTLLAI